MRWPGLLTVLLAALPAGASAGCLLGRQYAASDARELLRMDHAIVAPVDASGFYSAATCAAACPLFAPDTLERCYPVAVDVPVLPERIVECDYVGRESERRATPRAAIEAAHVDPSPMATYRAYRVDTKSCERFCGADGGNGGRVNMCMVEPDLPPTPAGDFVVCAYHHPGGSDLIIR